MWRRPCEVRDARGPVRTLPLWLPGYVATRLHDVADWQQTVDHASLGHDRRSFRAVVAARGRANRARRACSGGRGAGRESRGGTPTTPVNRRATPSSIRKSNTTRAPSTRWRDWPTWVSPTSRCICIITPRARRAFVDRVGTFIERLHTRHGLLRRDDRGIRFGFIHGNWALDNSLAGRSCLRARQRDHAARRLGCYADFTLPSAPSPAQTRIVNTIYWAKDDPARPKSHDTGVPVTANGAVAGDLLMIPGPLTLNLREWRRPLVPRIEVGELAGNCLPTRHRVTLWKRVAPADWRGPVHQAVRARRSGKERRAAARTTAAFSTGRCATSPPIAAAPGSSCSSSRHGTCGWRSTRSGVA